MKIQMFLSVLLIIFFIISCRSGNKLNEVLETVEVIVDSNISNEITVPPLVNTDLIQEYEPREGIINTDCDYYIGGKVSGRLLQGQRVIILEHYDIGRFDVRVEFITEDGAITGQVNEEYLIYLSGFKHDLWFKDIFLTREYYYTKTTDYIYANSVYSKGNDKERNLRFWHSFYSEERMRFTNNYLVIGNDVDAVAYRLESITKNGNTYTIHLSNMLREEYEITLVDDGDSIIITNYIVRNGHGILDFFSNSLNFRYVPYDEEKSEITRKAVITWIDEQLAALSDSSR